MTDRVYKRIFNKDIKNYTKDSLDELGIFIHFDESNLLNAKILIIGPEDTPYEGGYYIYKVRFPEEYPYKPPKVTFCSNSKIRIHPNMYVNGKVCLSILGTWSGPSWKEVMDINCVAKTIQSLMSKKTLQNEPGYQTEVGEQCINYDRIVSYENINSYIGGQVKRAKLDKKGNIERLYGFHNVILEHFYKNKGDLLKRIKNNERYTKEPEDINISIYNIVCDENYKKLFNFVDKIE